MADDNPLRSYRSSDPYRRAASPGEQGGGSDPLAELARLIGQSDPFAEMGRSPREAQPAPRRASHPAPPSAADWERPAPSHEQHFAAAAARPTGHESYAARDDYAHSAHSLAPDDAYADDGRGHDRGYAEPERQLHTAHPDDRAAYGVAQQDAAYGVAQEGDDAAHYYEDGAPLEPHEEETYDDAPRARRHGGLVTALALIGCAMLGTAGAYGYRTYSANPGSKEPVPVITADTATPTKVVPTTAIDPQSSKAMDRLANAAAGEQLVRRQEEPVALRELGTTSAPRVVLPGPVGPGQPGASPPPSGSGSSQNPSAGLGAPKAVRTVTIRPDGTDMSGRPVGLPPSQAPAAAPRGAASPTGTTTPPAPRAAAPARSGGPISLDPTPSETSAVPPPRTRTAVAPPAPAAPESATASVGGYLVQLSSQKTESDAQSSFRALQGKFPNELGGRQPVIRRADLGSKGVYYRTLVGPFRSVQEASQFCASYKAAGGQCVVPNN